MNILSPFNKIQFEDYCLTQEAGFADLFKRALGAAKVENTNASAAIPFPILSTQETNVWKAYCPNQRELSETQIAIHSEALKLVEQYAGTFDWFEVWYESEDQIDPLLIGKRYRDADSREKKQKFWAQDYLLCRWGEAIKPFAEIKAAVFESHLKRERVRLQTELNNVEFEAMRTFGI